MKARALPRSDAEQRAQLFLILVKQAENHFRMTHMKSCRIKKKDSLERAQSRLEVRPNEAKSRCLSTIRNQGRADGLRLPRCPFLILVLF